jgi:hypothetical protein
MERTSLVGKLEEPADLPRGQTGSPESATRDGQTLIKEKPFVTVLLLLHDDPPIPIGQVPVFRRFPMLGVRSDIEHIRGRVVYDWPRRGIVKPPLEEQRTDDDETEESGVAFHAGAGGGMASGQRR